MLHVLSLVNQGILWKNWIDWTVVGFGCLQALLAAGVGAAYAAPYLGRMVALGKSGMEDILEMQVKATAKSPLFKSADHCI